MPPKKAGSAPFTVAICTRNRSRLLAGCLEALSASLVEYPAPVIVLDNGSTDDTRRVAERYAPRIRYIFEAKVGLSHARNRAIEACETEYLVFLDDDGVPDLSWGGAVARLTAFGEADIFGGPYRPFYTEAKPAWFDDRLASAHLELSEGLQAPPVCLSGGNMGWRVGLLRSVGGFDPQLGIVGERLRLGEETALQIALHRRHPHLKVVFSHQMSMLHHTSRNKMRLGYILARNYMYGWQLRDIDPSHPFNSDTLLSHLTSSKLGLPLLLRMVLRNREKYRFWRSYAADYLTLNSIRWGALMRRAFGPAQIGQPDRPVLDMADNPSGSGAPRP